MAMTSPVLAIENLVVRYPEAERPTLDGLNLILASGDRLALVGPSGCGKSTVARAAVLLPQPEGPTKARRSPGLRLSVSPSRVGRSASG